MNIRINAESGVPIYMQIVDRIRHLVATGALRPGQQLPTIRQLAVDLRVDPNTVARAYAILDSQGVISTQQGRGTYIAEHPDEARLAAFRAEQLRQMMDHAILDALSLGYRAVEVRAAFLEQLARWEEHAQDDKQDENIGGNLPDTQ
ncbi:MAG: GntR family transcriptional regulator [Anaerolineae bacterium]|nr:GntR family transcriptional regulator [Anaerolineae bacterium]